MIRDNLAYAGLLTLLLVLGCSDDAQQREFDERYQQELEAQERDTHIRQLELEQARE